MENSDYRYSLEQRWWTDQTIGNALIDYYKTSGFSKTDYTAKWFGYKFLGIPVLLPNPKGRGNALRRHDFHHVLWGFQSDLKSECLISAFEIGSARRHHGMPLAAWFFNLALMTLGFLLWSKDTFNLYKIGQNRFHVYSLDDRGLDYFETLTCGDVRSQLFDKYPKPNTVTELLLCLFIWFPLGFLAGTWLTVVSLVGSVVSLFQRSFLTKK